MITIQNIIKKVSEELESIPGIVGVVLGGSRARGTHHPTADIDIGIYYDESAGFDVSEVGKIATHLDDVHREDLVSSLGEWGSWINGGAWLIVHGYHVDIIFRDVKRVEQVINDCLLGDVSSHYRTGHPHDFLITIHMAEVSIYRTSTDPKHRTAELKVKTQPYPPVIKDANIAYFIFEASASLMFAK